MCTHFDLLTIFRQGNRSMDKWYNAVLAEVNLTNTPQKQPIFYIMTSFGFCSMMKKFVSKTINNSNVDLEKFPARKVRQLVRKWKVQRQLLSISSKWLVTNKLCKYIYWGTSTQKSHQENTRRENLLPTKQQSHKKFIHENPQASSYNKKSFDPKNVHKNKDRCSKSGGSTHVEGFQCPAKKLQCKAGHKFGHFTSLHD